MSAFAAIFNSEATPMEGRALQRLFPPGQGMAPGQRHLEPGLALAGSPLWQRGECRLVGHLRIDNRMEVARALGLRKSPESGDGALVLAAHERWGSGCLERLVGDFAFVLWNGRERTLLAARDGLGMETLVWHRGRRGLVLVQDTEQLLAWLDSPPNPSLPALAGWIGGWPDPQASLFQEIEILPPGYWLLAERGGVQVRRFWDLEPKRQIRYRQTQDYARHLRELLERSVCDRMVSEAPRVATQMSGGMDSTTVTALASRHKEKSLVVVSHAYRDSADCDEGPLIRQMAEHLSLDRHRFIASERYLELDYLTLYPPLPESPGTVLSPRYLDEMALIAAEGAKVLLTGSGGDEMTWGHALSYSERLKQGELGAVTEVVRGCRELGLPLAGTLRQLFLAPLVPDTMKRLLGRDPSAIRLAPWLPQAAVDRLNMKERIARCGDSEFSSPALQARYQALRGTSTFNSVRSHARAGRAHGVSVRHPFFDTRLAEFSFAIPQSLWLREGYPKWLMRKSMKGLLPDAVRWNRNKVVFDGFFQRVLGRQPERIRDLLANPWLEEAGLLDRKALLSAYDATLRGDRPFNVDLLYALMTQAWVEKAITGTGGADS